MEGRKLVTLTSASRHQRPIRPGTPALHQLHEPDARSRIVLDNHTRSETVGGDWAPVCVGPSVSTSSFNTLRQEPGTWFNTLRHQPGLARGQ